MEILNQIREFIDDNMSGTSEEREYLLNDILLVDELKNIDIQICSVCEDDGNGNEIYKMDLEEYTNKIIDKMLEAFKNVLDSFVEEEDE